MVAVLLAAQLWVLEYRRARGVPEGHRDPAWWLVPISLVWANAHISYYMGLVITAFHLVGASFHRGDRARQRPLSLLTVLLACAAVSFLNPSGWRALAQPFEYFIVWRHEPIFQSIPELQPIWWSVYMASLLPLWLGLLPLLALLRARRGGFDIVQWLMLCFFVPQAILTQRFLGYLAIIVAPTFARDFDSLLGNWVFPPPASPRLRTIVIAVSIVLLPLPSLLDPVMGPGFGLQWKAYPVAACDWIEANGVRGRALNSFPFGGYLLWRFWPQRDRLPFMDIHQDGTTADRYAMAFLDNADDVIWRDLDRRHRFDWILEPIPSDSTAHLLDHLDRDPHFALVFRDDVAALYLRRDGADSALAARKAFRRLAGGRVGVGAVGRLARTDSLVARSVRSDLERCVAESRWNADAHSLLANLDLVDGRWGDALEHLRAARRISPGLGMFAERERIALDSLAATGH